MSWHGKACVLSWRLILGKNPHREALMPASPLALFFVSPGKLVQTVLAKYLCCMGFQLEALQGCLCEEASPLPV